MGRGRAKAKQTKVARELKYGTVNTDLNRLQAELAGAHPEPAAPKAKVVDDEDDGLPRIAGGLSRGRAHVRMGTTGGRASREPAARTLWRC